MTRKEISTFLLNRKAELGISYETASYDVDFRIDKTSIREILLLMRDSNFATMQICCEALQSRITVDGLEDWDQIVTAMNDRRKEMGLNFLQLKRLSGHDDVGLRRIFNYSVMCRMSTLSKICDALALEIKVEAI